MTRAPELKLPTALETPGAPSNPLIIVSPCHRVTMSPHHVPTTSPPSTRSTAPLMKLASSDARKR
jgi:hypothetical protein